jgi:hypothetical protein
MQFLIVEHTLKYKDKFIENWKLIIKALCFVEDEVGGTCGTNGGEEERV